MPASIAITNAVAYSGNYQSFNAPTMAKPAEGNRTMPLSFQWSTDGIAPDFAVTVDLRSQRNLQISQISALYVDNLGNDADVTFYFPDTQFRLDVPSYSEGVFPVITNGQQFIAYSPQASDGDATFVQVLNFYPPPISVTKTVFQTPAAVGGVSLPTSTTNTLLHTGAGTLHAVQMRINGATGSASSALIVRLLDSGVGGALIFTVAASIPAGAVTDIELVDLSGLDVIFDTALELELVGNADITGGFISVNTYISVKGS